MTAPRGVGSAAVSVVPDASGWAEKLRAQIIPGSDRIGSELGGNIGEAMYLRVVENIDKIRAKLDELGSADVNIRVKIDDNGGIARTEAELAAVDASAAGGGNGFNIFGSKIANIGALAVAAADIAIPAILAIGAAAAGALAGIGVLALGFSGIPAALQAHGQKAPGGGTGVANAGLSQQSAQLAATQATQSAQDQLTAAIQSQAKAEKDLHTARVQALRDLQDLDNKLKDNTLSQIQAAINLNIAKRTLAVTLTAPGASQQQYADQVAQARLNVQLAQQKVNELALAGSRLGPQDALAHKQGVAGNPGVLAAQQTLTDANKKLAEAQANIGITAQKNAIALQQAANSMVSAAAGANAFGTAMSKLNPLQKQFVDFLLQMKPLFEQLKTAASEFLPGLEAGIKSATGAFGPILAVIGNVAKAMGQVFANIGAQFATPAGQKFLTFLSVELPKQIIFLGNLFISFGKLLSGIFEAAAPLIAAFDQALLGSIDSMGKAANGGGLKTFFNSLIPLIKPTFQFLGSLGSLISSVLKAIAPALPPILNLFSRIADAIATLVSGPVGQLLVRTFIDLVNAVAPLVPYLLELLQTILPPLISFIDTLVTQALGPLIAAFVQAALTVLPPFAAAITALVKAIAPFIVQLAQAIIPILPTFSKLLVEILNKVAPLIPLFGQFLLALVPLVAPLTNLAIQILKLVVSALPPIMPLLKPFIAAIPGLVTVLVPLVNIFSTLVGWVIDFVNWIKKIPGLGILKDVIDWFNSGGKAAVPNTSGGTVTGPGGHQVAPIPHGARAIGGPVMAGLAYKVNEFGPEMFIPKVDGTIVNALDTARYKSASNGHGGANYFTVYGQSDPVATSHAVANRFAARAI